MTLEEKRMISNRFLMGYYYRQSASPLPLCAMEIDSMRLTLKPTPFVP